MTDLLNRRGPRPLTYLAVPYSHVDPEVMEARYQHATLATAWLMRTLGYNVFSPITHSHPLHVIGGLRGDWDFWRDVDIEYLSVSCRIVILALPGWDKSTGVTAEREIADSFKLEVQFMVMNGPNDYELLTPEQFFHREKQESDFSLYAV